MRPWNTRPRLLGSEGVPVLRREGANGRTASVTPQVLRYFPMGQIAMSGCKPFTGTVEPSQRWAWPCWCGGEGDSQAPRRCLLSGELPWLSAGVVSASSSGRCPRRLVSNSVVVVAAPAARRRSGSWARIRTGVSDRLALGLLLTRGSVPRRIYSSLWSAIPLLGGLLYFRLVRWKGAGQPAEACAPSDRCRLLCSPRNGRCAFC